MVGSVSLSQTLLTFISRCLIFPHFYASLTGVETLLRNNTQVKAMPYCYSVKHGRILTDQINKCHVFTSTVRCIAYFKLLQDMFVAKAIKQSCKSPVFTLGNLD